MMIHAVHTKTCGCTQTQPEPSLFVRIVTDKDDKVTGYLIAAAFTDDLRFFGTKPERVKYMKDVESKMTVKFEEASYLRVCSDRNEAGFRVQYLRVEYAEVLEKSSWWLRASVSKWLEGKGGADYKV